MAPLIRDRHRLERSTPVGFTRLAHVQAPISGKPRDRCLQRNTIARLKGVDARLRGLWTGVNALEVPRCARDTRAVVRPLGEREPTYGCRKQSPAHIHCFRVVIYNGERNSSV